MDDPQQQDAYKLALGRIAKAHESGAPGLNLSMVDSGHGEEDYPCDERFRHLTALPPEITDLTALRRLYLDHTQIADIAPLAELTALKSLWLSDTLVADIAPLAGNSALQTLILSNTQVADIAPLAGITALRMLWLDGTQVADIAPLAGLETLRDLAFHGIPACDTDPVLAKLSKIEDHEARTRRTLAYLRGETPNPEPDWRQQAVQALQKELTGLGLDPGPADGRIGPKTKAALKQVEFPDAPDIERMVAKRFPEMEAGLIPDVAEMLDGETGSGTLALKDDDIEIVIEEDAYDKAANKSFGGMPEVAKQVARGMREDGEAEPGDTQAQTPPPQDDPTPPSDETAPFYSDQPATQDLLNRRAVAETLGTIIDEVWNERQAEEGIPGSDAGPAEQDRTFIVHLHGRWGSGKTSILNFLREELLSGKIAKPAPGDPHLGRAPDPPWVIVDYNAWRSQNLGPAWWSLMDTVFRQAAAQLGGLKGGDGLGLTLNHYFWRFRARWLEYVGVLVVAMAVMFAVFQFDLGEAWLDKAKNTGTVVAVLVGVIALLNRLSIGTARTARQYMELARDPMTPLIGRYNSLIADIGRPVAVFIDDLDRCDANFVVELLQSVQTMFRSAPVLYVVAADRAWICASYEQVYAPYCEPIAEPGHSLGNMFLEKIFQLSVEVPGLTPAQRTAFANHLIRGEDGAAPEDHAAIETEATERLEKATTEQQVIEIVDEAAKRSPAHAAITGAQAFKRMQSKELVAERKHFLDDYVDLLEANPRAMKRLLNAYGFRRGFDIQSSARSDRDALVRWTILENRWPILADHLSGRAVVRGDGAAMEALKQDPEVQRVAKGLTREKLRTIIGAPANDPAKATRK